MAENRINEKLGNQIYDILVDEGCAVEIGRDAFIGAQKSRIPREYRLNSIMGSGTKFWRTGGKWIVDISYREQYTEEKRKAMKRANVRLADLKGDLIHE